MVYKARARGSTGPIDATFPTPHGPHVIRLGVVLIGVAFVACGATDATQPATAAIVPTRPPIPASWATIEAGDMELTVPADLGRLGPDIPDVILMQVAFDGRETPLQLSAHGPSALPDQPAPGESLRSWLERGSWFPREGQGGVNSMSAVTVREELLPAGRALGAAATVNPGSPEASRVVAYAVETPDGFAVVQILGEPDVIEERADELRLILLLFRFGD